MVPGGPRATGLPAVLTSAAASPRRPSPPCHSPFASTLSLDCSCLQTLAEDRERENCGFKSQRQKHKENVSLQGEMADTLATRKLRSKTCCAEATNRLACRS